MRELSDQEQSERQKRLAGFEAFLAERMPVLADFAERFELPEPARIVAEPNHFLGPIDELMRFQVIDPDDRLWILTRLGYFIGEVLVDRLGGCWFLNQIPDSRYFLRYVVGKFTRIENPNAMVDPFNVADVYLSEPPGRSLSMFVAEVERELREA